MDAVNSIREDYFIARKTGIVKAVHMTQDFYLELLADRDVYEISNFYDIEASKRLIFGFEPVIHLPMSNKPYWFDVDLWSRRAVGEHP